MLSSASKNCTFLNYRPLPQSVENMPDAMPAFREPSSVEKLLNCTFGFLVGLGLGFSYNYPLEDRGRKTGKLDSTPINLLDSAASATSSPRAGERDGCAMPKLPGKAL